MIRVDIKPDLLRWSRERAGYNLDTLAERFPNLAAWELETVSVSTSGVLGLADSGQKTAGSP
ncbi:MAG: hypothetical protein ABJB97_05885 [Acidobacteriota bacterium]